MDFTTHLKRTTSLAIPIVIGQLGHMGMAVVDNLMIGQLGAVHLAAASLANAIFVLFMVFGLGMSLALSPLIAAANREGNENECSSLLHHSLIINMISALILFAFIEIAVLVLPYLGQEERVIAYTGPYLQILAVSLIPLMFFQTYRQFSDGLTYARPAMYIMLVANLVNIALNWLFIFGNLGFPKLELNGAGIATFGTRLFAGFAMFFYVIKSKRFIRFDPQKFTLNIHKSLIQKILHIGIPASLQSFLEVVAFASVAFIIGWIGTYELAAHQIALTMASVTFMFALGVSHAAAIRVGAEFGKEKSGDPRLAGKSAFLISGGLMAMNGLIFIVFRYPLVALFIDNPAVQEIAAGLLVIAALFQIFDGVQAVGVGALRGIQDVKIPTIIVFISYWVLSIPIGYLLGITFEFGVDGVWYGFVSGLGSAAILLTWRFWLKTKDV